MRGSWSHACSWALISGGRISIVDALGMDLVPRAGAGDAGNAGRAGGDVMAALGEGGDVDGSGLFQLDQPLLSKPEQLSHHFVAWRGVAGLHIEQLVQDGGVEAVIAVGLHQEAQDHQAHIGVYDIGVVAHYFLPPWLIRNSFIRSATRLMPEMRPSSVPSSLVSSFMELSRFVISRRSGRRVTSMCRAS